MTPEEIEKLPKHAKEFIAILKKELEDFKAAAEIELKKALEAKATIVVANDNPIVTIGKEKFQFAVKRFTAKIDGSIKSLDTAELAENAEKHAELLKYIQQNYPKLIKKI